MNVHMSSMHISMEHGFGNTINPWSFHRFGGNLKCSLSPVVSYFQVAVLFTNIYSCLYRNKTCEHMYYDPPPLSSNILLNIL
ncbi:hypothetical protein C7212DRAFT_183323 [Tuber magnatum]|uniref:Uncharacterized protein n=1 Tax=Tuber magnatum TaxID=42249 RepID=A0A317SYB0_9PEZI|nr:hypothetical protein C7212DRAFT_183323 [Tuber magnatum]